MNWQLQQATSGLSVCWEKVDLGGSTKGISTIKSVSLRLYVLCVFQGDLLNFILLSHCVQDVAVKQLDRNGVQGNREFLAEVLMLSLVHHPNLVNLMGYCAEGDQRILVYEYMPKGSLENLLFGKLKLN